MLKSLKLRETGTICLDYFVILNRKPDIYRNELYTKPDKSYALRDDTATGCCL